MVKEKKEITIDEADLIIRKAKIRSNNIRRHIFKCLLENGRPLAHGEILANESIKHFNRVTVYRTLSKLQEAGLLHVVEGIDGIRRFCAHSPDQLSCPGNHPHFICQECGRMICLDDQKMPYVYVDPGMIVKGKQFVVYGICTDCAK